MIEGQHRICNNISSSKGIGEPFLGSDDRSYKIFDFFTKYEL